MKEKLSELDNLNKNINSIRHSISSDRNRKVYLVKKLHINDIQSHHIANKIQSINTKINETNNEIHDLEANQIIYEDKLHNEQKTIHKLILITYIN